ncbi:MAG: hypothetical protein H0U12_04315 [Thermoleophilaceae bacterium]|jgi:hypothetical protein|nr:hypothetical protein [Thermoleophilaceae bacterium]
METTPDRVPEPDRDRVDTEADAAAAEAAKIGGRVDDDLDPADRPVAEAGGGEAEGFELAEADLIESAEHADGGHDRGAPEPEPDRSGAVYGDPDNLDRTDETAPLERPEGGPTEDPAGR